MKRTKRTKLKFNKSLKSKQRFVKMKYLVVTI